MASYFGVLNRKYFRGGLFLVVCAVFLFLIYPRHYNYSKSVMEKSFIENSPKYWTPTGYKIAKESDVFGETVDSNRSVTLKTFFSTTLPPPGVILKTTGGIGNQLFQYACTYTLAKDLGWPLYLHRLPSTRRSFQPHVREFALDQFQIHFENIIDQTTKFSADINNINDEALLQRTFLDTPNPQNQLVQVGVKSFCESRQYWKSYEVEIKAMFQPRKSAINFPKLQKIINKISNSEESVVVHVRRGDFLTNDDRYFIPISYHRNAMRKMISILKTRGKEKPVFFVFSDDIAHAEKKLKDFAETYELVFVRNEIPNSTSIEDFYLMTLCKHIIIPNSTYSWWAAHLINYVDKIVIASTHNPKFYGPGYKFHHQLFGRLYHPKEWIVINPFTGGLEKDASSLSIK